MADVLTTGLVAETTMAGIFFALRFLLLTNTIEHISTTCDSGVLVRTHAPVGRC